MTTLRQYLEDNGIDQIKEDQTFKEEEYHAVQKYCETCGEVWHWFEESFDLSVAEDLMRAGRKTKLCQGK